MLWTLKEAAAEMRVSADWLRASDCPRIIIPTTTRKTGEVSVARTMVRFVPEECRAWVEQWHTARGSFWQVAS